MIQIIYCHPSKKGHCGKILKNLTESLDKRRKKYEIMDLYQMNFDPCYSKEEYKRIAKRDHTLEKDVKKAQDKLKKADTWIFIYPTWWYNMPARLKGFMDRVFVPGFAYNFFRVSKPMLFAAWLLSFIQGVRYLMQPYSAKGHLGDKKAIIFRSYGGPKLGKRVFGNTPTVLENVILRFCGLTDITVHELFNCDKDTYTQTYEDRYLKGVRKIAQKAR